MNLNSKAIITGLALVATVSANAQTVYGVTTDNFLVSFEGNNSTALTSKMNFTGLSQPHELILGLDFRPATGELYALGSSNRLYTINTTTGAATAVGGPFASPLNGVEFGFDFNPTVDRIRLTSDNGQNLRLNPNTGAIAATDANLAFAAGDPNFGSKPNVVGSAYTNNFAGAGSTTLYDIDSNLNALLIQAPPNDGKLSFVGNLGYNISSLVGFDIIGADTAYAAFTLEGDFRSAFYTINLATGAATQLGAIGGTALQVRDIAVLPEPASLLALGLGLLAIRKRRRS